MANYQCERCKRYFERAGLEQVCPSCFTLEEAEFKLIKEYLSVHPGATSSQLVNELNVTLKSIKRYLKDERLEILGDNKGFIRCELCGKPINSGRFCEMCYREGMDLRRRQAGLGIKSVAKVQDSKEKYQKGLKYSELDY